MINVPQIVSGLDIFLDGVGFLGTAQSVTLPKIEEEKQTIEAGGFARSINTGVFKQLEAEFEINEYNPAIFTSMIAGKQSGKGVSITLKGSLTQGGKNVSFLATMEGDIDVEDGSFKVKEMAQRKVKMYVDKYILEIDGKQNILFDVPNMVALIDGVDYLETLRKHIQ